MVISPARLDELDVIEKIYADARAFMRENGNLHQWKGGHPTEEQIVTDIEACQLFAVREGDDVLAVFAYIEGVDETYVKIYNGSWKNDLPYSVIHRIAVAKNAHGKGVARFCFDFAFQKYIRENEVSIENIALIEQWAEKHPNQFFKLYTILLYSFPLILTLNTNAYFCLL